MPYNVLQYNVMHTFIISHIVIKYYACRHTHTHIIQSKWNIIFPYSKTGRSSSVRIGVVTLRCVTSRQQQFLSSLSSFVWPYTHAWIFIAYLHTSWVILSWTIIFRSFATTIIKSIRRNCIQWIYSNYQVKRERKKERLSDQQYVVITRKRKEGVKK